MPIDGDMCTPFGLGWVRTAALLLEKGPIESFENTCFQQPALIFDLLRSMGSIYFVQLPVSCGQGQPEHVYVNAKY